MTTLWITRGLPASGKTTWARQQLANWEGGPGSIIRLNRDDLRRMALPKGYGAPEHDAEQGITAARDAALAALLTAGYDVICDDTNLHGDYVEALIDIAHRAQADVEVVDFTHVPLEECLRRDRVRHPEQRVGEDVIRTMHSQYLADQAKGEPS